MANDNNDNRASVMDTLERLRAEKYPQIPRELVREMLRLHADSSVPVAQRVNDIDDLVQKYSQETK